ncbi:group-specific protein [Bacillus sp. FJAT-42376]|uniref:group-specific protein n=1 Tax=Bacillus sp. FJAT-42376 TaxID=2014076 RepID=UPI000F4FBE72|nr:group-specific protein [Bacillus sp. FJAT-42376]AZB41556.1 group-specific protein [Bacillus sp. FJAT-42376]
MGICSIDHSREDVLKKLMQQQEHLPHKTAMDTGFFLQNEQPQETLNDVFHLLKKYDLASAEEREERNDRLNALVSGGTES